MYGPCQQLCTYGPWHSCFVARVYYLPSTRVRFLSFTRSKLRLWLAEHGLSLLRARNRNRAPGLANFYHTVVYNMGIGYMGAIYNKSWYIKTRYTMIHHITYCVTAITTYINDRPGALLAWSKEKCWKLKFPGYLILAWNCPESISIVFVGAILLKMLVVRHIGNVHILMSYRQISWSLEGTRLGVIMTASLWNFTGISAALLPRCLSNCRAMGKV